MKLRHTLLNPAVLAREEQELLTAWAQEVPGFVFDGLPDPAQYCRAPLRILYLLKEVNGGESWDLRQYLREGARRQTWNVVARWTEAILHPEADPSWAALSTGNDERRKAVLPCICAVNLKKTAGTYTADPRLIHQTARQNGDRLKQQLALYQPDIIICCGTGWSYARLATPQPVWRTTSRGVRYFVEPTGTLVIDYVHPEARVAGNLLHYALIDAIREILS